MAHYVDGDAVDQASDLCPDEAEDVDGFNDGDGCPDEDNDGDGIVEPGTNARTARRTVTGSMMQMDARNRTTIDSSAVALSFLTKRCSAMRMTL